MFKIDNKKKLERTLKKIILKKSKITLLTVGPRDYDFHGAKAGKKMEDRAAKHNQRAKQKLAEYDKLITELLLTMLNYGYSIEDLKLKYPISDIISTTPELKAFETEKEPKML